MIRLGDMLVHGETRPKLLKALGVVATRLHPILASDLPTFVSHESCILCALIVRDFLFRIGFRDAEARPVMAIVTANVAETGEAIHTLGIGRDKPGLMTKDGRTRWEGHLVTVVHSENILIDATLYSARRPAWPDLPGMVALPLMAAAADEQIWGLTPIAGMEAAQPLDGGGQSRISAVYLDQPANKLWKKAPDAVRSRREIYVSGLVETFGDWKDAVAEGVRRGEDA